MVSYMLHGWRAWVQAEFGGENAPTKGDMYKAFVSFTSRVLRVKLKVRWKVHSRTLIVEAFQTIATTELNKRKTPSLLRRAPELQTSSASSNKKSKKKHD